MILVSLSFTLPALALFVANNQEVAKGIIENLQQIKHWFENVNHFRYRFISSSLLIIHEPSSSIKSSSPNLSIPGHQPQSKSPLVGVDLAHNDEQNEIPPKIIVKMIDFAHVYDNNQEKLDANYLFGLNNLIQHLNQVHNSISLAPR